MILKIRNFSGNPAAPKFIIIFKYLIDFIIYFGHRENSIGHHISFFLRFGKQIYLFLKVKYWGRTLYKIEVQGSFIFPTSLQNVFTQKYIGGYSSNCSNYRNYYYKTIGICFSKRYIYIHTPKTGYHCRYG